MSAPKNILCIGLSAPPEKVGPETVRNAATAEQLRATAKATIDAAREAGYNLDAHMYHESEILDKGVPEMEGLLKANEYQGFFIGFGLRGIPEFTVAFEKLVNLGRTLAPKTPMGFNTKPDPADMMATFKRAF